jgi:hypothetical protein
LEELIVTNSNALNPDFGRVIQFQFPYQNEKELSKAIRQLSTDPKGDKLKKILKTISEVTGDSFNEIKKNHKRYKEELNKLAKKDRKRMLKQIKKVKPEFLGSLQQLRFGQLLSEHLDINPIFSALLSPTGGLIGPGAIPRNIWFYSEKGVMAYHAAVHDAAGFLCIRETIMPGYEYITNVDEPCESSPLSGQVTGILYWYRKLKKLRGSTIPAEPSFEPPLDIPLEELMADTWVELNPDELLFVSAVIGAYEKEYSDEEIRQLERGEKSLIERNLIEIDNGKYEFDNDLIAMIAVSEDPQKKITTKIESETRSETISEFHLADEFVVEETYPQESVRRFSFINNPNMISDRIVQTMYKTTDFALAVPEPDRADWEQFSITSVDFINDEQKTEVFTIESLSTEGTRSSLESDGIRDARDRLNSVLGGC